RTRRSSYITSFSGPELSPGMSMVVPSRSKRGSLSGVIGGGGPPSPIQPMNGLRIMPSASRSSSGFFAWEAPYVPRPRMPTPRIARRIQSQARPLPPPLELVVGGPAAVVVAVVVEPAAAIAGTTLTMQNPAPPELLSADHVDGSES